jgi:hypothetical protein
MSNPKQDFELKLCKMLGLDCSRVASITLNFEPHERPTAIVTLYIYDEVLNKFHQELEELTFDVVTKTRV